MGAGPAPGEAGSKIAWKKGVGYGERTLKLFGLVLRHGCLLRRGTALELAAHAASCEHVLLPCCPIPGYGSKQSEVWDAKRALAVQVGQGPGRFPYLLCLTSCLNCVLVSLFLSC